MNDKLTFRAIASIFMGYSEVQKRYELYNIETKTFFLVGIGGFMKKNHFARHDDESSVFFNEQFDHHDVTYKPSFLRVPSSEPQVGDIPPNLESYLDKDDSMSQSNHTPEETTYVPRQSRRNTRLPIWHKDY